MKQEPIAEKLESSIEHAAPTPWEQAQEHLAGGDQYWLATIDSDGKSHIRPIVAVWYDDGLYFVSSPTSAKAKHLARDPQCVITVATETAQMVVEGEAQKISDENQLKDVAEAYDSKYQWQVSIRDGAFYANGAPTAGPPPYEVYKVVFDKVYGFGTHETFSPTRWRF